ncbi:MAG: adenylate/guanylate cyclase domain-containing protein [Gammaproteobacteria bacterium]|nr:adenylate/guanylate cyclase domain-containing protein [Gammaproteobacteria bacterium]
MKWIETTIAYLFPAILLEGKPWRSMWEEKERNTFTLVCRYLFFLAGIGYVGHYFFYDKIMDLQPIEKWFTFRMTAAALSFATFLFYFTPLARSRYYKLPAIITCWIYCYTQAMVTTWWDGTPWMYSFLFVTIVVLVIRTSPLYSILLASMIIASQTPFLVESGVPLSSVISTGFVTLLILMVVRTSHLTDIRNFALNQDNIAAQKQIIELNIEFADRIRAFIPKVIARRLENYINQNRLTVLQAAIEVLKARKTNVACLFSDIRGYTLGSKDLDAFVNKSMLPEMKACSDKIEEHFGIPRKIGDLIFAYFDDESNDRNTLRAINAGMEIARLNQDMNATVTESEIRRYILISTGEAIVGNLGGLDSSIEITALGSPVNLLSRLDDLTKDPIMVDLLNPGDLIVCQNTFSILERLGIGLDCEIIDLCSLGLAVRDFPETQIIYRIEPNDKNYDQLQNTYRCTEKAISETANDLRLAG